MFVLNLSSIIYTFLKNCHDFINYGETKHESGESCSALNYFLIKIEERRGRY